MHHDISKIKDAVRTTIVIERGEIEKVIAYFKELEGKGLVERVKRQVGVKTFGYTGTIVNIKCSNGILGEIQINTPKMIYAKEKPEDAVRILGRDLWDKIKKEKKLPGGLGHKFYEELRVFTEKELQTSKAKNIIAKSHKYYANFLD